MNRTLSLLFVAVLVAGCANTAYQFERLEGERANPLPLKFDSLIGRRDGAVVTAEARFSDGSDQVTMDMEMFLRPPAEFKTGSYRAHLAGRDSAGRVECTALTLQGGQTPLPTVGGLFLLKDDRGNTLYRVRIPATTLTRPVSR